MPAQLVDLDLLDLHSRALAATRRVVAALGPDQWDLWISTASTDVRTLVGHIVVENSWVEVLLAGQTMEEARQRFSVTGETLGTDALATYNRSAVSAEAAFRSPGILDTECHTPPAGTRRLGSSYLGTRFVDVLIHGWEIAKVTGQDTRLDQELATAAHTVIEPEITALRDNGVIKAGLDLPDGADAQARFLALFGFSD
jgi:uncharacterized protein (TIGR03086 family)